ncbi:MAG: lytic transglycosylase domain-containing protein [Clostridia bacterium]|nr:lytic transglycosylase domain-containing protein [Clostridia bacterium]
MTEKKKILHSLLIFILTLSVIFFGTVSILKVLYPIDYNKFVEIYSKENNLSPSFVFAVIECESGFDKNAESSVGARGLMQIMPETFFWLQTKTGEKLSDDALYDPETSIKYGCYFYGMLMQEFKNEEAALAAYHAGMGNVRKWLQDERYSLDGETLYDIPFPSTKNYVHKVMKTKNIYDLLYYRKDA